MRESMKRLTLAICAAALWAAFSIGAVAQSLDQSRPETAVIMRTCGDPVIISETLAQRYDEHLVWMGRDDNGDDVKLFVSDGGTWTLAAMDGGRLCLFWVGRQYDFIQPNRAGL